MYVIKNNEGKPKTPKQKKPDYSSLYKNKDGTINKERRLLLSKRKRDMQKSARLTTRDTRAWLL